MNYLIKTPKQNRTLYRMALDSYNSAIEEFREIDLRNMLILPRLVQDYIEIFNRSEKFIVQILEKDKLKEKEKRELELARNTLRDLKYELRQLYHASRGNCLEECIIKIVLNDNFKRNSPER